MTASEYRPYDMALIVLDQEVTTADPVNLATADRVSSASFGMLQRHILQGSRGAMLAPGPQCTSSPSAPSLTLTTHQNPLAPQPALCYEKLLR